LERAGKAKNSDNRQQKVDGMMPRAEVLKSITIE
jgi:hypothetical protein